MRQFSLAALVALSFVLAVPAAARAQTSVAVLALEPVDVPEDIASQVTRAVLLRVDAARQLRTVPGKPLVELKLVFGCLDEAPACMAQIGSSLNAERLVYGAVRKGRGGYAVTLKYFNVSRQRIEKEATYHLLRSDINPTNLTLAADRWFAALTGIKSTGTLRIASSVAGARIFVDDRSVGTAGGFGPVMVTDLAPGAHQVRVEHEGYKKLTTTVTLSAGETLDVNATLEREFALEPTPPGPGPGPIGPTPEPAPPGRAARIAFWGTAGASILSFALAGYAAYMVADLEDQKDATMRKYCENYGPDSSYCLVNVPGNDACAAAAKPYNAPRNPEVAGICDSGKSWAASTWVLFPVAGALAAASGFFFWSGYLSPRGAEHERPDTALRLQVTPVVSPGVAALTAELRF